MAREAEFIYLRTLQDTSVKKMLVPFDEKNPGKVSRDFIYPETAGSDVFFTGIKKTKKWNKGMVVYTGKDITANDLFAKIVDSGKKIDSVQRFVDDLREYLLQVSEFSIGNILEIQRDGSRGFRLKKVGSSSDFMETSKIP